MPYANVPRIFNTDPGESLPTSRYYVYPDGTIRAKFAEVPPSLHVRPGKNICFVDYRAEADPSDLDEYMRVNAPEARSLVAYSLAMDHKREYQKPNGDSAPADFFLVNGKYDSGFHNGHRLTADFHAKIEGLEVNPVKLDQLVVRLYGPIDKPIRADAVAKVSLVPYAGEITGV
ncbi:MAG TPA: hypothetical protein VGG48_10560 [Rhizomicrobium sp.]|jgi:hypothetical protein